MELDQNLIEEGKALVVKCESSERMTAEVRFELGRWALKAMPHQGNGGDRSSTSPMGDLLKEYASAIGLAAATLQAYRDVTHAWEGDDPSGLSWTVARKLAYRTDRMALIDSVFQMFGKVTPKTIDDYEAHLREENKRRESLFKPTTTCGGVVDGVEDDVEWEEEEDNVIPLHTAPTPQATTGPRKHGFSAPIRKLEALVIHCRNTKDLIFEESIPSVDYANDEHFEEILTMLDNITTDLMEIREALASKREKAGLSPNLDR